MVVVVDGVVVAVLIVAGAAGVVGDGAVDGAVLVILLLLQLRFLRFLVQDRQSCAAPCRYAHPIVCCGRSSL